jgi:putative ABC transport system substrate-binding protein
MKRAIVLAAAVLLFCLVCRPAAEAQSLAPVPRIGVLRFTELTGGDQFMEAFRLGLRELGYIEGKNLAVEWRTADGRGERAGELAAELVRLKVSIIVASGTLAAEAARRATRRIPIVLASVADARGSGFVTSLARPGGNITGVTLNYPETTGKQLELLRERAPAGAMVAEVGDEMVRRTEPQPAIPSVRMPDGGAALRRSFRHSLSRTEPPLCTEVGWCTLTVAMSWAVQGEATVR